MKFKSGNLTRLNNKYTFKNHDLYYIKACKNKCYYVDAARFPSHLNDSDLNLYTDIFSI
jgi:hypothetical protein